MYDDRKRGNDKSRLSWREIDQIRDKSRARDRDPMHKQSSPVAMQAQKSYRAALERAFANGKLDELAKTLTPQGREEIAARNGSHNGATKTDPPPTPPGAGPPPPADPREASPVAASPVAASPVAASPVQRDPERDNRLKMIAKIKEAEGREPITRAVDAYFARYPKLPDDYEVLTKVLSHKNDDRVRETLAQLDAMITREKPRRARTLVGQLRILEDTHTDSEIRSTAAAVRARL